MAKSGLGLNLIFTTIDVGWIGLYFELIVPDWPARICEEGASWMFRFTLMHDLISPIWCFTSAVPNSFTPIVLQRNRLSYKSYNNNQKTPTIMAIVNNFNRLVCVSVTCHIDISIFCYSITDFVFELARDHEWFLLGIVSYVHYASVTTCKLGEICPFPWTVHYAKLKLIGKQIGKSCIISIWMRLIGVFLKWSRTFIEISKFRESEKSLKHELGSILGSSLLPVSLWHSGITSVSCTKDSGFKYSNSFNYFVIEFSEFSENFLGKLQWVCVCCECKKWKQLQLDKPPTLSQCYQTVTTIKYSLNQWNYVNFPGAGYVTIVSEFAFLCVLFLPVHWVNRMICLLPCKCS